MTVTSVAFPSMPDPKSSLEKQVAAFLALMKSPGTYRIWITPELAAYILDPDNGLTRINRTISPATVTRYAESMSKKAFGFTSDTIKLDEDGQFIDGYHRLTACVRSGAAFETNVAFGIKRSVYSAIDTGRKRTGGDVLKSQGFKNWNARANTVRWHMIFTSGNPADRGFYATNEQIKAGHEALIADKYFAHAFEVGGQLSRKSQQLVCGPLSALLFIYGRRKPQCVDQFASDAMHEVGDAHRLNKTLQDIFANNGGRMNENTRTSRFIITLNAYYNQTRLPRSRKEPFWDSESQFPSFPFKV